LAGIAKAVKGNSPSVSSSVQKLADDSIKTLDALRADAATTPETATKVRFVMAQAYQTKGQFDEALKLVEEILKQNPMMLDVQVEAARMLQASGTGKSAEMLTKAVNGYLPNTKTRQNTIWGWGRISQLTSGKPNLVDTFFESRLELARCRYLQAMLDKTPESKTKLLQRALSDITQTIKLYPELGGAAFTGQFDKLTRDLQRELKQNVVGLKGLSSK
jgi:tetratricopeptide (TPR) repeat protein